MVIKLQLLRQIGLGNEEIIFNVLICLQTRILSAKKL